MLLFNLIFRSLSSVILVIRNGCLPKFGHLQSTVNKLLENAAPKKKQQQKKGYCVVKRGGREAGFVLKWGWRGVNVFTSSYDTRTEEEHTHSSAAKDDKASKCDLMTSCV